MLPQKKMHYATAAVRHEPSVPGLVINILQPCFYLLMFVWINDQGKPVGVRVS